MLAALFGASYASSYANWEVASWAWQFGIALAALFSLAAFRLQFESARPTGMRVAGTALCALAAAWGQGAGFAVPGLLAVFVVLDRIMADPRHDPPPLWPALAYAGVAAFVVAVYLLARQPTTPGVSLVSAVRDAPGIASAARLVLDWLTYGIAMAFYGPLVYALGAVDVPTRFYSAAAVSVLFLAVVGGVLWSTRWRGPVVKLALYALVTFLAAGSVRFLAYRLSGYSYRYQTYGLLPTLSFLAFLAQALLDRVPPPRQLAARRTLVALLLLSVAGNVHRGRRFLIGPAISRGEVVRADYARTKRWLLEHASTPVPDGWFNRNAHPAFRFQQLAVVIGLLDPSSRGRMPTVYEPTEYVAQEASSQPWGPIFGKQVAVQTFSVTRPGRLFAVELALATYGRHHGPGAVVTVDDDAGAVLLSERLPPDRLFDNQWASVLTSPIPLAADREYRIELRATGASAQRPITAWMNTAEASYQRGETVAPDGVRGDLAFRIGYVPDPG
jgi:hypothetical protein